MKKLISIAILLWISFFGLNAQNSLTVELTGFGKPAGKLYIALYDSNVPFLSDKAISGKIVSVSAERVSINFDDLKNGEYAIAIYHDENDNGKLDLGDYGIPAEKYGFSNNIDPVKLQRPPVFSECKFTVNGNVEEYIQLMSAIK